jgi:hypothetical protein
MINFQFAGRAFVAALALMSFMSVASAQQPGTRIRGQIEKAEGNVLTLKTREGASLQAHVAGDARISALEKASLKDIKNDTFIGIAGMPRPDGSIDAFSIHIFLPAQRGVVPDRHGPWDARQGSTMTNAYVEGESTGTDPDTLKVKYKDGEKIVHVTPETAIAAATKGDKSELKVGAQIIIFGWDKQPDGSILAKTLYVGRGLTPAM